MKGLIVKSHIAKEHDILNISIPDGFVDVMINISRDNGIYWNVGGFKMAENTHYSWKGGEIQIGDEVSIKLSNINNPSPPLCQESHTSIKRRMTEDVNIYDEEIWKRKIELYHRIETILKNEKIID